MKSRIFPTVSAIVPAYNEEKFVGGVLSALANSRYIDEVICINDGSTDDTALEMKKVKGIQIINLRKNHGKGYAIALGIQKSKGDIVAFFDADLIHLQDNAIYSLIEPLLMGECVASLGYANKNLDKMLHFVTGERAYFKKDLLPYLKDIKEKGYGLELYLNYIYKNRKTKTFPLVGVRHMMKHEKQSIETVAKLHVVEGFDILLEMINQTQTLPIEIKDYISRLYSRESPEIQKKIKKILKNFKRTLLNSIS